MITMPRMRLGHEYHWAQVGACGPASVILVIVAGTAVGLAVPAAFARAFPEPESGPAEGRREAQ